MTRKKSSGPSTGTDALLAEIFRSPEYLAALKDRLIRGEAKAQEIAVARSLGLLIPRQDEDTEAREAMRRMGHGRSTDHDRPDPHVHEQGLDGHPGDPHWRHDRDRLQPAGDHPEPPAVHGRARARLRHRRPDAPMIRDDREEDVESRSLSLRAWDTSRRERPRGGNARPVVDAARWSSRSRWPGSA
jgi:hypothetical protein